MKKLASGLLFSMSLCGCGGSSSSSDVPASPPPPPSGAWATVDSDLHGFLSSSAGADQVQGYTFAVVTQSGVVHTVSGGNQSNSSQDFIASSSKLPSALAILTLVNLPQSDPKHIDLDTPISTYLAGSAVTWPTDTDHSNITMRMLLNHTSGIPGLDHESTDPNTYPQCANDNNLNATTMESFAQCAQDIANIPLTSVPGQVFDYGGADFQLAGYVATVVSGESTWQGFFNDHFATPMGIDTNVFTYGSDPNPRVAGGVTTDVANYALILQMLLNQGAAANGNQILDSTTLALFRANQILGGLAQPTDPTPLQNFYPPNLTPATNYPGYSFGLFFSAASLYTPSPGPEFSDPGSYGTTPWIDLDSGSSATLGVGAYAAILLINNGPATPVGVDIWNAVRPDVIAQCQTDSSTGCPTG